MDHGFGLMLPHMVAKHGPFLGTPRENMWQRPTCQFGNIKAFFFFINLSLLFPVVSVQAARYKTLGGKPRWEYGFDEVNTNGVCRV